MSYYYGWKPYVPVAERRKKAEKHAAKAAKAGKILSPIAPYRGAIAKTVWGKAWCENLEHYSDYGNRLPRGRTYVRNGSVIDLQITEGSIHAQVMGSSLYNVKVTVAACSDQHWRTLSAECASSIDSLVELLQGKLSSAVMQRICQPGTGLFPVPKDIRFQCSCPDGASMCKHVAAVLYGIGARFDQQPALLFTLRGVDAADLINDTGTGLASGKQAAPTSSKVLDDAALGDVFGIEIDTGPITEPPIARKRTSKQSAAKTSPATTPATPKKSATGAKPAANSKSASKGKPAEVKVKPPRSKTTAAKAALKSAAAAKTATVLPATIRPARKAKPSN